MSCLFCAGQPLDVQCSATPMRSRLKRSAPWLLVLLGIVCVSWAIFGCNQSAYEHDLETCKARPIPEEATKYAKPYTKEDLERLRDVGCEYDADLAACRHRLENDTMVCMRSRGWHNYGR